MQYTQRTQPHGKRATIRAHAAARSLRVLLCVFACAALLGCDAPPFLLGCLNDLDCPSSQSCVVQQCAIALCTTDEECSKRNGAGSTCARSTESEPYDCTQPPPPVTKKKYGETCNDSIAGRSCLAGLFCLTISGKKEGFCSNICGDERDCKNLISGQNTIKTACIQFSSESNEMACVFTCNGSPALCQAGLTCRQQGNGKLCLP